MENLKLHLGIVQRAAFAILKTARLFQSAISQVYWSIFVKTTLWVGWVICGRKRNKEVKIITLYQEKRISFLYGKLLGFIMKPNGWLNGLKHAYSSYDLLLGWNPSVPLIALKQVNVTYSLNILGEEYVEENRKGWRPVLDGASIGTSTVCGHFMITNKFIETGDIQKTVIECVWLTGEHKGQKFTMSEFGVSINNRKQNSPSSIYFPPRIIVWLFEVIISISAVAALVGAAMHVWPYILNILHQGKIP